MHWFLYDLYRLPTPANDFLVTDHHFFFGSALCDTAATNCLDLNFNVVNIKQGDELIKG